MKELTPRQIGIEMLLGVALCAGGYFLLVDPAHSKLSAAREKIATLTAAAAAPARPIIPPDRAEGVMRDAAAGVKEIETRSGLARDQAALFEGLNSLAARHHIHIDQMVPMAKVTRRAEPKPAALPPPGTAAPTPTGIDASEFASVGYGLTLIGGYPDIAEFIADLQSGLGYTRVRGGRLEPAADIPGPYVRARIETQHLGLAPPSPRPDVQAQAPEAQP